MAGNFENNAFKKSGRKKWTLFRGSRGLFQRVGSEMAEDGCPDAQYIFAIELMNKSCDSVSEETENAREGIYWLIKASEQGHAEATNTLQDCLQTGKGITEHNISEVIECLETTTNEKLSVKAMKHLFMNFSEGEEFITSNQLIKKLREVEKGNEKTESLPQIEDKKLHSVDRERKDHSNGQKLTEDTLISAARTYARGELPDIGQSLVLSEHAICKFKPIRALSRILLFPLIFQTFYSYLLSFNPRVIFSLLYVSPAHLKILFLLFVCNTVKFDTILSSLPIIVYYLSFFSMIGATCQMLKYRQRFRQFRCWSNLFLQYGGDNFSPEEAEYLHCRNGLTAYGIFFASLLVNLFVLSSSFPLSSFFQAEITFAAFGFTILTLIAFTCSKSRYMTSENNVDCLSLFSFMLYVLAKYPYETDSVVGVGWRFLDLQVPTFASYVVGHGIEFCLNFRAFFYLIIPAVLVKMAARYNWRGAYSDLIPHCVTLAWWQLTLIYAQDATWYSLIRPALAVVGVLCFLPLTILASIFLPVYATVKYVIEYENLWYFLITFLVAFGIPAILFKKFASRRLRWTNYSKIFQVFASIITAGFFLSQSNPNFLHNIKNSLTESYSLEVKEFVSYCNSFETPYTDTAKMESELMCSQMLGLPVYWKGRITKTKLTRIYNPISAIVNKLPMFLVRYANCMLGEEYPLCGDESFRISYCKSLSDSCHLSNWNVYEFEILVDVLTDSGDTLSVTLVANHNFVNFTRKLNTDDDVWFVGTIMNDEFGKVDSISPRVQLSSITCVSCLDSELTECADRISFSSTYLYKFVKYLLNFSFNPLIVFK